jgi:nickel-dependent lactate racemase
MNIQLAYGETHLPISLPDEITTVIEPKYLRGITREREFDALTNALRAPIGSAALRAQVNAQDSVAILICDITRAIPTARILPPLLRELSAAGVADENIVILDATGTHRASTDEELRRLVGDEVFARYRVENHGCRDDAAHTFVGTTRGGRAVRVGSRVLNATVRILTGFIEPHFFAGFSGGPKMVVPGMASLDTVMQMHDAELIAAPNAHWGVTHGNPLWEELYDATQLALNFPRADGQRTVTFNYNITLNRDLDITGIFAGDLLASHNAGCEFARVVAMQPVPEPFDIVVTTNSGYPLDLNLYQTIKGVSAAALVVKEGGEIVVASECREGLPAEGSYRHILKAGKNPDDWLTMICAPGFHMPDQWQVQIQAQVQKKARLHLYADGLSEDEIYSAQIQPTRDVERTVRELIQARGSAARVCVLPEGPQTIPYLAT